MYVDIFISQLNNNMWTQQKDPEKIKIPQFRVFCVLAYKITYRNLRV